MTDAEKKELYRQKELETLRNSYEMYERSKDDMKENRATKTDKYGNRVYTDESIDETLELMNQMQDDVVKKYKELGGNEEDLKKRSKKSRKTSRKAALEAIQRANERDAMKDYISKFGAVEGDKTPVEIEKEEEEEPEPAIVNIDSEREWEPQRTDNFKDDYHDYYEHFEEKEQVKEPELPKQTVKSENKPMYDMVSLPSKGECYKSKKKELQVAYLVAYDENLILSPSLYMSGTFLDHILKNKIMDNIDPDSLVQGDRDAIIIWLRANGYGNMYPIIMTDEETGKEYETSVDLTKLKFKKFNLKGDENGYFDYTLPVSGDVIKFKFLTNGDEKRLIKMHDEEDVANTVTKIKDYIRTVREFISDSEEFTDKEANALLKKVDDIENSVYEKYEDTKEIYYTHDLTNRLILSTISVNGNTDRKFVANYIASMNLKDAADYRKYIIDNEPGIDYNVEVERPESLGGGYVKTFLRLNQFIFVREVRGRV